MKKINIKFNVISLPYLIIAIVIMFSYSVFLTFGLITSYISGDPTLSLQLLIIWLVAIWLIILGFSFVLIRTLIGRIEITEKGICFCAPFMKPIVYFWEEILSCGLDIVNFNLKNKKMIYFSKCIIPPLDYSRENYIKGNHIFWKKFVREKGAYWSLKKERNLYLRFMINEQQLIEIKNFLPICLLIQLEEADKRLAETYPDFKKYSQALQL